MGLAGEGGPLRTSARITPGPSRKESAAQFRAPLRGQEQWEALVSLHKPQIKAKLAQVTQGRGVGSPPG